MTGDLRDDDKTFCKQREGLEEDERLHAGCLKSKSCCLSEGSMTVVALSIDGLPVVARSKGS